jgi:hypothetical protein
MGRADSNKAYPIGLCSMTLGEEARPRPGMTPILLARSRPLDARHGCRFPAGLGFVSWCPKRLVACPQLAGKVTEEEL